jgi:hypothetical protein
MASPILSIGAPVNIGIPEAQRQEIADGLIEETMVGVT